MMNGEHVVHTSPTTGASKPPASAEESLLDPLPLLSTFSDNELLSRLWTLLLTGRRLLVRVLDFLNEIEDRRLHSQRLGCPTLYLFCIRKLGFSESEAYRRTTAAALLKRFPALRPWIEDGRIRLTTLTMIREHLRADNFTTLIEEVAGKSKVQVEEVLARIAPKADAEDSIQKMRRRRTSTIRAVPEAAQPTEGDCTPTSDPSLLHGAAEDGSALSGEPPVRPPPVISTINQLSPERYKVVFTASEELKRKLERAKDLMSHQVPKGDLATIIECALDLLIAKRENQKFGKTDRPRPPPPDTNPQAVHRETRREVSGRDGEQCAFVAANGERCTETKLLEFDHIEARALGGTGEAKKIRLLCRAHNRLVAEQVFGREFIEDKIRLRQKGRPPVAVEVEAALVKLGFQTAEARRAVGELRTDEPRPVADFLREALAILTPVPAVHTNPPKV